MYKKILTLFIFILFSIAYADSAVQTDWSGGPGVLIQDSSWTNTFHWETDIDWSTLPSTIVLPDTVIIDFYLGIGPPGGIPSVYSEDINNDGYMDILCAGSGYPRVAWLENTDGSGTSWTEHVIDGEIQGVTSIYSTDLDSDGDMDILGASCVENEIIWWENLDGSGLLWIEHCVGRNFVQATSVYSEDIDGDGDMDILGAARLGDEIAWWENLDGSGTSWTKHLIDEEFNGARSVYSADLDGDGDMDALGAASTASEITWWENADGSGLVWIEHSVASLAMAMSVYSEDIDNDGDMDILGASYEHNKIVWFENTDGSGTSWIGRTVGSQFGGASSVYSEDLDDDGDMDVLGAAHTGNNISWWENIDGSGTSWVQHTVDDLMGARCVYSEDFNGDGKMDVLGGSYPWAGGCIKWYNLYGYPAYGYLASSILYLGSDPDWGAIDWSASTPPETSVSFRVRASDDYSSMGAWSLLLTAPCELDSILSDSDRYFQYMVLLESVDQIATPSLNDITLSWDPLGIGETSEPNPQVSELLPIAPNPSNGSPMIRFGLPEPAFVGICIFDLSGRLISEVSGDEYSLGYHEVRLTDLNSGIYFCRMISGEFTATQQFVVIE